MAVQTVTMASKPTIQASSQCFGSELKGTNINIQRIAQIPTSKEFWISDGNIVLKTRTIRYRVHHSMLCRHSSVFKAMLTRTSAPAPTDGLKDDGPVWQHISVQGADRDWDTLLSMFYDTPSLRESGTGLIPFGLLQALLRLGHVYGFAQKEEALKQLKEILPDTLEGWDHLNSSGDHRMRLLRKFGKEHALTLLCIVRELNIKKCLPMAYFNCLRYRKSSEISCGRDPVVRARPTQSSLLLCATVQVKLFAGKEKIRNRLFTHSLSWWHNGNRAGSCVAKIKCTAAIKGVHHAQRLDENPVSSALDSFKGREGRLGGLCRVCMPEAMAAYNTGRSKLFNELPLIFCGVQGWNELEDNF